MGAPVSPPLSELVGLPLLLLLPFDVDGSFKPVATAVLLFSASIDDDVGNEDEGEAGDDDDDSDD